MAYSKTLEEVPPIDDEQLLISREQARMILGGVCYNTVFKLEAQGKLTPVQLNEGSTSKIFYLKQDVIDFALSRRKPSRIKDAVKPKT